MSMKNVVIAISIGCVMLTGCLQMQLQSDNEQTRMEALELLTDRDLSLIIRGRAIKDGASKYFPPRHEAVSYNKDVKIAAVNKLYDKGKYGDLIDGLRHDEEVKAAVMAKIATPDEFEKLYVAKEKNYDNDAMRLLQKVSSDDFFVWVAQHEQRPWMTNVFGDLAGYHMRSIDCGPEAVSKIKSVGALITVAQDHSCIFRTRFAAAEKALDSEGINGNDIRTIMASFDGCENSRVVELAEAAIKSANRVGAMDVAQEVETKYYASIKQKNDEEEAEKRKEALRKEFANSLGQLHEFFIEGRSHNAKIGDIFCNVGAPGDAFGNIYGIGTSWDDETFDRRAIVKQVVNNGVVVGCAKEIQRVQTGGGCIGNTYTTKYTTYRFTNRIFVKTSERFADGDPFNIKHLKYLGTTTHTSVNGSSVTLHTFEPYQVPDEIK